MTFFWCFANVDGIIVLAIEKNWEYWIFKYWMLAMEFLERKNATEYNLFCVDINTTPLETDGKNEGRSFPFALHVHSDFF